MIFSRNNLGLIVVAAAVVAIAHVMFGLNTDTHAASVQTGRSYFENVSGPLGYTSGASNGCVGGNLIGYVIPNYTQPDLSKPAGQRCNGSGAVGDMRMMQVVGNLNDRREGFYQVLKYDYYSGNAWEQAGATQVALSLLGFGFGSGHSRTVSPAEWTDLHDRITAPDVQMLWASDSCAAAWCLPGVPFQFNTAGVIANGNYDSIRVDNGPGGNVDAWVFRSIKTGQVYGTFEIECGNGIGNIAGLPLAFSFTLTPSIAPIAITAEAGSTIGPISPSVTNSGPTDSYANTPWELTQFTVVPGGAVPGGATNTQTPCAYFNNGCPPPLGSGSQTFPPGTTSVNIVPSVLLADLPSGSKVCFALSVKGYDQAHLPGAADWKHGVPVCVKIAKKPKLQIWGGDLRTRGNITTSVSTRGAAQYGSWVEYAAFSTGSNAAGYNFASGSGFAGGTNTTLAQHNLLTFANTAGSYGKYALPAMPAVAAQFTTTTPVVSPAQPAIGASSLSLSGYASGTYKLTSNNVTLNASDLKGTSIVLIAPANGTVTIAGDIRYLSPSGSDTFSSPSELPQLIIIANAINISGATQNVNAWLLTTGAGNMINTCSDVSLATDLNSTICDKLLTVNGPVATDTLYLRRTGGADSAATADTPAEKFNLRADTYLWASAMTTGSGRARTDNITEAAPRF